MEHITKEHHKIDIETAQNLFYELWESKNEDLDYDPDFTEVNITGSGTNKSKITWGRGKSPTILDVQQNTLEKNTPEVIKINNIKSTALNLPTKKVRR